MLTIGNILSIVYCYGKYYISYLFPYLFSFYITILNRCYIGVISFKIVLYHKCFNKIVIIPSRFFLEICESPTNRQKR